MQEALFYLFAAMTVVPALMLVVTRNVVNAAMLMIVSFIGTAALFGLLQAYFLAILQVLVYAGAVVVLFLFIIMLLDASHVTTLKKPSKIRMAAAAIAFLLLVLGALSIFGAQGFFGEPMFDLELAPAATASNFGVELFTRFMLPFQLAGFLLLAAMIGVIYISKKETKSTAPRGHSVAAGQPSVVKER